MAARTVSTMNTGSAHASWLAWKTAAMPGQLPNPASLPGADPDRVQIVEEAFIQENLGEFPDRSSDQGEHILTPAKANRRL